MSRYIGIARFDAEIVRSVAIQTRKIIRKIRHVSNKAPIGPRALRIRKEDIEEVRYPMQQLQTGQCTMR